MTSKTPPTRWLRYDEAAEALGISKRQLQRAVQQRKIGFSRLGNATLFSQTQLDEFVEACTFTPAVSA